VTVTHIITDATDEVRVVIATVWQMFVVSSNQRLFSGSLQVCYKQTDRKWLMTVRI